MWNDFSYLNHQLNYFIKMLFINVYVYMYVVWLRLFERIGKQNRSDNRWVPIIIEASIRIPEVKQQFRPKHSVAYRTCTTADCRNSCNSVTGSTLKRSSHNSGCSGMNSYDWNAKQWFVRMNEVRVNFIYSILYYILIIYININLY